MISGDSVESHRSIDWIFGFGSLWWDIIGACSMKIGFSSVRILSHLYG